MLFQAKERANKARIQRWKLLSEMRSLVEIRKHCQNPSSKQVRCELFCWLIYRNLMNQCFAKTCLSSIGSLWHQANEELARAQYLIADIACPASFWAPISSLFTFHEFWITLKALQFEHAIKKSMLLVVCLCYSLLFIVILCHSYVHFPLTNPKSQTTNSSNLVPGRCLGCQGCRAAAEEKSRGRESRGSMIW